MSHHHGGAHDFLYFTMHTNIVHGFFAPNCGFWDNVITIVWFSLCLLGGNAGNCDRPSDWSVAMLVPQPPVRVAVERGAVVRRIVGAGQVGILLCLPV